MLKTSPTDPFVTISVNLKLSHIEFLNSLVDTSISIDDPASRSEVLRLVIDLARDVLDSEMPVPSASA